MADVDLSKLKEFDLRKGPVLGKPGEKVFEEDVGWVLMDFGQVSDAGR